MDRASRNAYTKDRNEYFYLTHHSGYKDVKMSIVKHWCKKAFCLWLLACCNNQVKIKPSVT